MRPRYTNTSSIEPHPDYPLKMYYADEADARIAKLEKLLHRVIEWEPPFPVESGLADDIAEALQENNAECGPIMVGRRAADHSESGDVGSSPTVGAIKS